MSRVTTVATLEAVCPFTGQVFRVLLAETGKHDRHGRPVLCGGVWLNSPTFPGRFNLAKRFHGLVPGLTQDHEEAARAVIDFLGFEDCSTDELDFSSLSASDFTDGIN
jgi:hypothetical protein